MAGITALGTTFNLPNFHGELLQITPDDTPLLSAAGGLNGGKQATSTSFEWQEFDLREPQVRPRLEGQDAPNPEARVRANKDNIVQIFHEAVATSYTKQAAVDLYASAGQGASNPVTNEHAWQITQTLKQIARDVNYTFWHGKYNKPADNTTARQTRGLFEAITSSKQYAEQAETTGASTATDTVTATHSLVVGDKVVFTNVGAATAIVPGRAYWVVQNSTTASFKVSAVKGGAPITIGTATGVAFVGVKAAEGVANVTSDRINGLLQSVFTNGGISEQGTATLYVPPNLKPAVTAAYAKANNSTVGVLNGTRNVGGVSVDTIITDFGTLNVAIERALPADALAVLSLEQIDPVFLSIPGKGVLFEEELAKTGSSDKTQVYGEIGLSYGNERSHGIARGFYSAN